MVLNYIFASDQKNLRFSCELEVAGLMFLKAELAEIESITDPTNRLGFSVLLLYLKSKGYFPDKSVLVNSTFVVDVAEFLEISAKLWKKYKPLGRTAFRHRQKIKELLKFKSPTGSYKSRSVDWLVKNMEPGTDSEGAEQLLRRRFIQLKIVAPKPSVLSDIAQLAVFKLESTVFDKIAGSLTNTAKSSIEKLLKSDDALTISDLKQDPGRISLESSSC